MTDHLELAVKTAPVLRALSTGEHATQADLAAHLGRDPSNLAKTLKSLRAADLLSEGDLSLTEQGWAMIRRLDVLDGSSPPPPGGAAAPQTVAWAQIFNSPLNPRRDFDSEAAKQDLADLADDLFENGQIQELFLKPRADDLVAVSDANGVRLPTYEIVAGERRWRAMGLLIQSGRWPADHPIRVRIEAIDELRHRKIALAENLRRRNLNPIEEAQAFKAILDLQGGKTREIAEELGSTQRLVQQRLQLLQLDPKDQERVAKGELSLESARWEISRLNRLKINLPAGSLMMLAEIYAKLKAEPVKEVEGLYGGPYIEVADDIAQDPNFAGLEREFVYLRHRIEKADCRSYLNVAHDMKERVERHIPDLKRKGKAADDALKALRLAAAEAAGLTADAVPVEGYMSRALNGPYSPPEEAAAAVREANEHRRAAEAERERREAEAKARREAEAARVDAIVDELSAGHFAAIDDRFQQLVHEAAHPLPWVVDEHGWIVAADANIVVSYGIYQPVLKRLIVLAVNAAAGLRTPSLDEHKAGIEARLAEAEAAREAQRVAAADAPLDETALAGVREICSERLTGGDPTAIVASTTFSELDADSLDAVELVMAAEERWQVSFDDDAFQHVETIGDAVRVISAALAAAQDEAA